MWKITRDYINPKSENASVKAESTNWNEEMAKLRQNEGKLFKFRILDDDRNVYFHGLSTTCDTEAAFAPLDDFAMPNYGATIIEYKNESGTWAIL